MFLSSYQSSGSKAEQGHENVNGSLDDCPTIGLVFGPLQDSKKRSQCSQTTIQSTFHEDLHGNTADSLEVTVTNRS